MRLKRFQSRIDCNHSSKSVCYRHVHVHVTKIIIKWEEQEDGRVNEERKKIQLRQSLLVVYTLRNWHGFGCYYRENTHTHADTHNKWETISNWFDAVAVAVAAYTIYYSHLAFHLFNRQTKLQHISCNGCERNSLTGMFECRCWQINEIILRIRTFRKLNEMTQTDFCKCVSACAYDMTRFCYTSVCRRWQNKQYLKYGRTQKTWKTINEKQRTRRAIKTSSRSGFGKLCLLLWFERSK